MAIATCTGCARPGVSYLRRRRSGSISGRPEPILSLDPLCSGCGSWLASLILRALAADPSLGQILGAPSADGRNLIFDDQCAICRKLASRQTSVLVDIAVPGRAEVTGPFLACSVCDAWLIALAQDSRSARREAARGIDGPYGRWPHPNLRGLSVELDARDEGCRLGVVRSCRAMDVPVIAGSSGRQADVLFVEASETRHATARLRASEGKPYRARVVLAPLNARDDLLAALSYATDWLTVPLTPQQVTAALGRVARQPGLVPIFDTETGLPFANVELSERPVLEVTPLAGTTRFEAAWLLKRFSRGYDEAGISGGHIVLLPRIATNDVDPVVRRLSRLYGGRCPVRPLATGPARLRFEAAR